MSKISDAVAAVAAPIVAKNDCELWDVEYVKEAGGWFLRVYIDRADGVSIDHCEAVSRELDRILDEDEWADRIPGSYTFEVSSAGAERYLRRESDFLRFIGHFAEFRLYKAKDGQRIFLGTIVSYQNGEVEIDSAGQRHKFEKKELASVRLRVAIN